MRTPKRSTRFAQFTALLLLVALGASLTLMPRSGARAAAGRADKHARPDKVSPELRKRLRGSNPSATVRMIVQSNGDWTSRHDDLLAAFSGTGKTSFNNLGMGVVELPANAAEALASYDEFAYVSEDAPTKALGQLSLTTGADTVNKPKYDSTALGYIPSDGTGGKGIGIAILDSGLDTGHWSMKVWNKDAGGNLGWHDRILANVDFTTEHRTDDPYGHGSHVAAIAAGSGRISNGAYMGVAPLANILNLRVLDSNGTGRTSYLLNALNWILSPKDPNKPWDKTYNPYNKDLYNIRVVNMSLGTPAVTSYKNDPLCQAVRRLVDAGIVVVAAAGNDGKDSQGNKLYGRIHSPGNEPSALTVGASNTMGTDGPLDDRVTTYSSRGPTRSYSTDAGGVKHYDNQIKPDLVAPGNRIISAESDCHYLTSQYNYLVTTDRQLDAGVSTQNDRRMMELSGTSMATPTVSGAAALLLQANPKMTPNMVKAVLMYTAQPLAGYNMFEQGAGQLNIEGAMRLAKALKTDINLNSPAGTIFTRQTQSFTDKKTKITTVTPVLPTPQTTTAGQTFPWAQGVILGQTFATGTNVIGEYQKVYGTGILMGDGIMMGDGILVCDGIMMSDGILLGDNILMSDGTKLGGGTVFTSTGILLGDGIMMSDGIMIGDGILMGDGIMVGDGILIGDSTVLAQDVLTEGDNTPSMPVVVDSGQ
jgi:subtilisin family serine protease